MYFATIYGFEVFTYSDHAKGLLHYARNQNLMKNLLKYLSILPFCLLLACDKNEIKLPPATEEGKGILGCLVNGEVFVAQGGFIWGINDLTISVSRDQLSMRGAAYGDDTEVVGSLSIHLSENFDAYGDKTTALVNSLTQRGRFRSDNNIEYLTGQDKFTGEFTITKLDTVNYIIAGTFWFDAVSEDGEVVEIRQGRFDIDYNCCTQY